MIKAVIFDCFGVLAEDGWLPFKRQYIGENESLALAVADLGKQNEYGMVSIDKYFRQVSELIGVDENLLRKAVGKRVPNTELLEFIKNELKPKYKIGLLSNANFDVLKDIFTPDQAVLFDASVVSYEAKLIKPDGKMYELMAARLGVGMQECIFVDDVERYCVAAEDLGMKTIVYESPTQTRDKIKQIANQFV